MLEPIVITFGETDTAVCADAVLSLTDMSGAVTFTLLDETLYPGVDGVIEIDDLCDLVQAWLRVHRVMMFSCSVTPVAADGTRGTEMTSTMTLLYAAADTNLPALAFTQRHFLTTIDGEKLTAMGREERVSAYGLEAPCQLTVRATVVDAAGECSERTAVIDALNADGVTGISVFDVSPQKVADAVNLYTGNGARLASYTVSAGQRSQAFLVGTDAVPPAPSLYFVNSFGCYEFLHCTGEHRKVSKYDRKTARLRGKRHQYKIEEDRQFTGNTGWLNSAMADWADELFRSDEVYVWDRRNGTVFKEVVLSDSKSEVSNADDDMPSFSFVYGYAQRLHNVMQVERGGRVFDSTFDQSFN